MTTRDISSEMVAATAADVVWPVLFLYGDFQDVSATTRTTDSGASRTTEGGAARTTDSGGGGGVRIWTGVGQVQWNGQTWEGLGHLLKIDPIVESTDSAAQGITVEVDGFQDDFFSPVMLGDYQGRPAKVWFGLFSEAYGDIISDPYLIFSGILDSDEVIDSGIGESSKVVIRAEHRLSDLLRPRSFRYTYEDQQTLYPEAEDAGLEFIAALQEVDFSWGRA